MAFLLVNNVFLIRFTSPVYPGWQSAETVYARMMGGLTNELEFAISVVFAAMNVAYLVALYRSRKTARPKVESAAKTIAAVPKIRSKRQSNRMRATVGGPSKS